MTDAPQDESKDSGSEMHPDGWAAWGKKAGDPLTPPSDEKPDSPKTDDSVTD